MGSAPWVSERVSDIFWICVHIHWVYFFTKSKRWWNFIKEHFVSIYNPYIWHSTLYAKIIFETFFVALKHRETKAIRFIVESIKLYFESHVVVLSFVFLIKVFMWPNNFFEKKTSICCLLRVSRWFLAWLFSSTLKMKATCSSETSVDFQGTTWRYTPEDITLHNHSSENLSSYKWVHLFFKKKNEFYRFYIYILGLCNVGVEASGDLRTWLMLRRVSIGAALRLHAASIKRWSKQAWRSVYLVNESVPDTRQGRALTFR
jgi:hypothetical protein